MIKKSEIKQVLKKMQVNFNPEKNSYKIIDEIIKNNLTAEEMLSKIQNIKGISKFPVSLKREYNEMIAGLNLLVVEERKQKEVDKKLENTRKLKEIVEALEKDIKPEDKLSKEEEEEEIKESLGLIKRKKKEIEVKEEIKEEKQKTPKDKKTFNILLPLVILSIIIIILIVLFY